MSINQRKTGVVVGLGLAVILPFLLFWITKLMSPDINYPKYFNIERKDSMLLENGTWVYDSSYHKVKNFTLTNQHGNPYKLYTSGKNKIIIAHLFFTNCMTICPKLTNHMKMIQEAYKKKDSILQILSITVDPGNDDVQKLREYSLNRKANPDVWFYLTGNKNDIFNIARTELFLDSPTSSKFEDDLIHSEKIVLIDKNHFVRGYYNGLDSIDLRRLADDITLINLEK